MNGHSKVEGSSLVTGTRREKIVKNSFCLEQIFKTYYPIKNHHNNRDNEMGKKAGDFVVLIKNWPMLLKPFSDSLIS